jgi:hypothetical protein
MKKLIVFSLAVFFTATSFGQHKKMDSWKELKSFHEVMAATYHPAEKGDFKPIRERAGEMVTKAEALADSKIPTEFYSESVKVSMAQLVERTRSVKTMVDKNASDAAILKMLTGAHQSFHEVMGEKEGKEEHKHHDAH